RKITKVWNFPDGITPARTGLDINQMFRKAGMKHDNIKAMILIGENPLVTEPDQNMVEHAVKNLEFLVVSDIFFTKTCEFAHVVLPAACYAEKDGTVTNTERRVQRLNKAVMPPGIAKPDWQIITELACLMGYERQFPYKDPADIFREITAVCEPYQGMTFSQVSLPDGICWPCPSPEHPGTAILYTDQFYHPDGKGIFCPVEWKAPTELPDSNYPFRLTSGRVIWHWHTGTMTRRSKNLNDEVQEAYIEVHPADAEKIRISDGEMVLIRSRKGQLSCKTRIVTDIKEGMIFMPSLFDAALSRLIGTPYADPEVSEYRPICVALEPVSGG
ncbi:MAG: molybdopterin-dependent oxidoreductase, partial [Methanospirillum sp.]|nr:molybdopterin-dependent oxidoreductase [Methanospirillum sp.]